jgi:isoleucyl-tRNA synthetase
LRDDVNLVLEGQRQQKVITSNLSARVRIGAGPEDIQAWQKHGDFLPTLLGVSHVEIYVTQHAALEIQVDRANGEKCSRCWRYVASVSAAPDRTGLCPRCVDALAEPVSL